MTAITFSSGKLISGMSFDRSTVETTGCNINAKQIAKAAAPLASVGQLFRPIVFRNTNYDVRQPPSLEVCLHFHQDPLQEKGWHKSIYRPTEVAAPLASFDKLRLFFGIQTRCFNQLQALHSLVACMTAGPRPARGFGLRPIYRQGNHGTSNPHRAAN